MLIERLRQAWRADGRFHSVLPNLTINAEGLVLGPGTVLAARRGGRLAPGIDADEARIAALLSIVYEMPVPVRVLSGIRRAAGVFADGKTALAHIHLAQMGLPPVADEDACRRLFFLAGLADAGVAPQTIARAAGVAGTEPPTGPSRGNPYHDEHGRFTDAVVPVADKTPAPKPPTWTKYPNSAFREKLAELKSNADKPGGGYDAINAAAKRSVDIRYASWR